MKIALAFLLVAVSCTRDVSSLPAPALLGELLGGGGGGGGGGLLGGLDLGGLLDGLVKGLPGCLNLLVGIDVTGVVGAVTDLACALRKRDTEAVKQTSTALLSAVEKTTKDASCLLGLLKPVLDLVANLVKDLKGSVAQLIEQVDKIELVAATLAGVSELICPGDVSKCKCKCAGLVKRTAAQTKII
ncbi:uncharacterized protein LOC144769210 [Lissotriton helveticus]